MASAWRRRRAVIFATQRRKHVVSKVPVRPTELRLHQQSRVLEITFEDGTRYRLPCEYLRVYSPSAEVRGHGPGQEVLQLGKENVNISAIEPVGAYAVRLVFDDGHDTGLYSWEWLHHLATGHDALWREYLERLAQAGHARRAGTDETHGR
jgi:DUF971 family protein